MGHSGHFDRNKLDESWKGYERLAELCEQGGLTNPQAECVLLWCRGFGWADIGRMTHRSRSNSCRDFWTGVRKIGRAYPSLFSERPRWAHQVLFCFRNRLDTPDHAGLCVRDYYGRWTLQPRIQVVTAEDLAPPERQVLTELLNATQHLEVN